MRRAFGMTLGILATTAGQFVAACGGSDASTAPVDTTATSSGTGGSATTGSSGAATTGAAGSSNGAAGTMSGAGGANGSGTSGTSTGAGGGSGGSTVSSGSGGTSVADASGGAGGALKDASSSDAKGKDGGGPVRDAAGCVPSDADRCDSCTSSRCCVELDACEANAACKAAYAAIDACIGDAGSAKRERGCYNQFAATDQRAKTLADCVIASCPNQCNL